MNSVKVLLLTASTIIGWSPAFGMEQTQAIPGFSFDHPSVKRRMMQPEVEGEVRSLPIHKQSKIMPSLIYAALGGYYPNNPFYKEIVTSDLGAVAQKGQVRIVYSPEMLEDLRESGLDQVNDLLVAFPPVPIQTQDILNLLAFAPQNLTLDGPRFEQLDVSKITGHPNFSALQEITLLGGSGWDLFLGSLEISNKIKQLANYCIGGFDGIVLPQNLAENKILDQLYIDVLYTGNLPSLINTLKNKALTSFKGNFKGISLREFLPILKSGTSFRELEIQTILYHGEDDNVYVKEFMEALSNQKSLRHLVLNLDLVLNGFLERIANYLRDFGQGLERFEFSTQQDYLPEQWAFILKGVNALTQIPELRIWGALYSDATGGHNTGLQDPQVIEMYPFLSQNIALKHLELSNNRFTNAGLKGILRSIQSTQLTSLMLNKDNGFLPESREPTPLEAESVEELKKFIQRQPRLESLDLTGWGVNNDNIVTILSGLNGRFKPFNLIVQDNSLLTDDLAGILENTIKSQALFPDKKAKVTISVSQGWGWVKSKVTENIMISERHKPYLSVMVLCDSDMATKRIWIEDSQTAQPSLQHLKAHQVEKEEETKQESASLSNGSSGFFSYILPSWFSSK